jgi:transcriptional regulator with XRE-family HTH domain
VKEDIGRRLRQAREAAGLSQSQLAAMVGAKSGRAATISDWESGRGDLGADVLAEIRNATGVDGHWLLTGEGSMWRVASHSRAGEMRAIAEWLRSEAEREERERGS